MSVYTPQGTPPVITSALARIERMLPQAGEVLVRVGQRVEPEDVVARALLSAPPQIINVARALAIAPARVERAMVRELGNKIAEGEVLARSRRLGGRTCLATVSGVIAAVDNETGYVTIAPDPQPFELLANVRGIVMDVQPFAGVVVETPAGQVYGAWGMGEERSGVLKLLVTDPSEQITDDKIDARHAYAVLIGGAGVTAAALRRAVQENVRGIITGSIEEHELRAFLNWADKPTWHVGAGSWQVPDPQQATDPGLTLIVTEGFGTYAMSEAIFYLLTSLDQREALIEGVTQLRHPLRRPRVVVPLTPTSGSQVEPPRPPLRPGATVRLLDPAHLGQTAFVRSVPALPRQVDSGVRTSAVEVMQEGGEPFFLPRTAIEVIH